MIEKYKKNLEVTENLTCVTSRFFLLCHADLLQPLRNRLCTVFCLAASKGKPFCKLRLRLHFLNSIKRTGKAAAPAGIKRSDRLSGKIIVIQKCIEDHRHIAPPVGELNRRSSPLVLDFTGFNGIQKCVLYHPNSPINPFYSKKTEILYIKFFS